MIYVCGSINLDRIYHVSDMPKAGETVAAHSYREGLGGKGANQAIAASRAGAKVAMIGAVGADGRAGLAALERSNVDVSAVTETDQPTGHAVIFLDATGENRIVIVPGANHALDARAIDQALSRAQPGDIVLLQNEIALSVVAAKQAQARGMTVIYSAAPFDAEAVAAIQPFCDLLAMNAQEHEALIQSGVELICPALVTAGAEGVRYMSPDGQAQLRLKAPKTEAVDTTGAGDCFIGNYAAARDQGKSRDNALAWAVRAAAVQVTRAGAAAAMPWAADVHATK